MSVIKFEFVQSKEREYSVWLPVARPTGEPGAYIGSVYLRQYGHARTWHAIPNSDLPRGPFDSQYEAAVSLLVTYHRKKLKEGGNTWAGNPR